MHPSEPVSLPLEVNPTERCVDGPPVPCRQAVHGVGGRLRLASLGAAAAGAAVRGSGRARPAGLGGRAGHHVVGGPGRLVGGGGQRPPLEPGVLAAQGRALRGRGRGQLPQCRGQRQGLVSVGGGDLRRRRSNSTALTGSPGVPAAPLHRPTQTLKRVVFKQSVWAPWRWLPVRCASLEASAAGGPAGGARGAAGTQGREGAPPAHTHIQTHTAQWQLMHNTLPVFVWV